VIAGPGGSSNSVEEFDYNNETWCQFHQPSTSIFCTHRSQKSKKTDNLTVFFTHLGSARIKAVCREMMKLTSGVNFIKLVSPIKKLSAHRVWQKNCRSISPTIDSPRKLTTMFPHFWLNFLQDLPNLCAVCQYMLMLFILFSREKSSRVCW